MSIIQKLEPDEVALQCCDYNDICEGEVTHCITDNSKNDKKFYCKEHTDELREIIFKK